MAEALLFHHAQGQTAGFHAFANELRSAGHTVHTPTSSTAAPLGRSTRVWHTPERSASARSSSAGCTLRTRCPASSSTPVFARRGAGAAARADAPGRKRALLFYSCLPTSEFGTSWPADAGADPRMDADPIFVDEGDIDAARELVESAEDAELFLYPGDQHYFADSSLPSYDESAATPLTAAGAHVPRACLTLRRRRSSMRSGADPLASQLCRRPRLIGFDSPLSTAPS